MTDFAIQKTTTSETEGNRYRSILKSSSLIGGASVLNILIGMLRTKFVAILLGTTGVGLMGMYVQITGLIGTVSGMGLASSGVRQVAEAVGSHNDERIARSVITLRRMVWLTGGIGMLTMIIFCAPISKISFNSSDYTLPIALLGGTILLSAIASGQACMLQGTRRIADLARISVIGAVNGTLISIPCFYFWGKQGIVISLILCAVALLATSWWFARRVPIKAITLPWRASRDEARQLLSLGIGFMGAGLVATLASYLIRVMLLRKFNLSDVGIYLSAYGLSGVLVGFVLTAMGTDYYPRLTAVASDNTSVRQMVNEQTDVSILLAFPCLVAMMIFAPLLIRIFYAESFFAAIPILRWCILGILGRVFSWPLGFVILAKGKGRLFFITELLASAYHVVAVYYFVSFWGLNGAGIAFMSLYLFYTLLMLVVMRGLVGAIWSRHTLMQVFFSVTVIVILFFSCSINFNSIVVWGGNLGIMSLVSFYCIQQLSHKSGMGLNEIFSKFRP